MTSSALRHLAHQPHGDLVARAFLAFRNCVESGLMSEDEVAERIMQQMQGYGFKEEVLLEAIRRGFETAKGKHQ